MVKPSCEPELLWLPSKEIGEGHFEPFLDQLLTIPGHIGYIGRGVQIVRGNILRGRPKFPNSLNIRYLDDQLIDDELKVNDTLHGGPACLCADGWGDTFWKGPVVAFLKAGNAFDAREMMDVDLTAYRDAIDYLSYFVQTYGSMIDEPGSHAVISKRVMKERSGRVKGVKINCIGDRDGSDERTFEQVYVPKVHPLINLEGDDPLEAFEHLNETCVLKNYPPPKDASVEDRRNPDVENLLLSISRSGFKTRPWRHRQASGSALLVDRGRQDLDIRKVRAVCQALEFEVLPRLRQGDQVVLTEELVQHYM